MMPEPATHHRSPPLPSQPRPVSPAASIPAGTAPLGEATLAASLAAGIAQNPRNRPRAGGTPRKAARAGKGC